jgi:hypothetical protein
MTKMFGFLSFWLHHTTGIVLIRHTPLADPPLECKLYIGIIGSIQQEEAEKRRYDHLQ